MREKGLPLVEIISLVLILAVIPIITAGCSGPAPIPEAPSLSDALKRGCQRTASPGDFGAVGPAVGETAVDFTLKDIHGNTANLAGLLREKPVVMVFGSFT